MLGNPRLQRLPFLRRARDSNKIDVLHAKMLRTPHTAFYFLIFARLSGFSQNLQKYFVGSDIPTPPKYGFEYKHEF